MVLDDNWVISGLSLDLKKETEPQGIAAEISC